MAKLAGNDSGNSLEHYIKNIGGSDEIQVAANTTNAGACNCPDVTLVQDPTTI